MKFKIAEKTLYRVPQFPIDAILKDCWDELKKSIALSSPDFYKEIVNTKYENWQLLSVKSRQTILKYFNRSKYRPVPFGTFAAVGLIDPKPNDSSNSILLDDTQIANSFIDWPNKEHASYQFEDVVDENCFLFSNSTYYVIPGGIRYVFKNEEGFELADLDSNPNILRILKLCSKPVRLSKLIGKLSIHLENQEDFLLLIKELILEQLLFTSKDPNIIGEDYFQRIGYTKQNPGTSYVIAERKYLSGTIDKKLLCYLPVLVDLLLRIAKAPTPPQNLKTFKEHFIKRFDRMELPIMQVLDPELGLGYGQLESVNNSVNSITDFLPSSVDNKEQDLPTWKTLLIRQLSSGTKHQCLSLDQLIRDTENFASDYKVANTMSALIQVVDGQVVLNHLGGYSTNQFAGRFSLGNEEIYKFCKETAAFEQEANPDVLFFDVGYTAEIKVDNVNRRRKIYDYQLSILNYDTSIDPLTLDDLMVCVKNDEVILRSKRLNKRMVPRLATAYNHGRSDLPVYRFLCDLNIQGLITNLSFSITELQPELSFYPRIQYHNIIVSTAMWRLSHNEYEQQKVSDDHSFETFILTKGIPKYIKVGVSDQTLLLDLEAEEDRILLESQLKRTGNLLIEEVLFPTDSIVKDSYGRPFLAQMLVSLQHNEKIYRTYSFNQMYSSKVERFFVPGSEWLYFELYCHPQRADQILQKLHEAVIQMHQSQIKKWFFIRYNENGEHLRIRLHLFESTYAGSIMKAIYHLLNEELEIGIISDVQIKTYKRELERYSEPLMENIEMHFFYDSEFILHLLNDECEDNNKYQSCLLIFNKIWNSGLFPEDELLEWLTKIYNSFTKEHRLTTEKFKKLNSFIRNLKSHSEMNIAPDINSLQPALVRSLSNLIQSSSSDRRLQLFTDLMHMHINRMFDQYQRTHEMLIYDLLLSTLKKEKAISKFKQNVAG
jgi:thiopeptide-type bacteriocin biosynthesis protein